MIFFFRRTNIQRLRSVFHFSNIFFFLIFSIFLQKKKMFWFLLRYCCVRIIVVFVGCRLSYNKERRTFFFPVQKKRFFFVCSFVSFVPRHTTDLFLFKIHICWNGVRIRRKKKAFQFFKHRFLLLLVVFFVFLSVCR